MEIAHKVFKGISLAIATFDFFLVIMYLSGAMEPKMNTFNEVIHYSFMGVVLLYMGLSKE